MEDSINLRGRWGRASTRWLRWSLLLGFLLLGGCSWGFRSVSMQVSVLNSANRLLSVEGQANLPNDAVIQASLRDPAGRRLSGSSGGASLPTTFNGNAQEAGLELAKARTKVHNGRFFLTLDVSEAPGNEALTLEIVSRPDLWPDDVKGVLGSSGEYMMGAQVETIEGVNVLLERIRLVLPMNRREASIRRIRSGDYVLGISALEGVVEANPKDYEACICLALALLSRNSEERKVGSRASSLIRSVPLEHIPSSLRQECQGWLAQWKDEEEQLLAQEQERKALESLREKRSRERSTIVVGASMGGISLGDSATDIFKLKPPKKYPDWSQEQTVYQMLDSSIQIVFDSASKTVIELSTSSRELRLANGIHVGSELTSIEEVYPGGSWEKEESVSLDSDLSYTIGYYTHPSGVSFRIKQFKTLLGGLHEVVVGITVFPDQSLATPQVSTSAPAPAPAASPSDSGQVPQTAGEAKTDILKEELNQGLETGGGPESESRD